MWGSTLSRPLPIAGLVGRYPANYLIGRTPIPGRQSFTRKTMRPCGAMGYYLQFPAAVPRPGAGSVRVTHPCATRHQVRKPVLPFDLHVLGLPLAFILSQDQTLRGMVLCPRRAFLRTCRPAPSPRPNQRPEGRRAFLCTAFALTKGLAVSLLCSSLHRCQ